MKRILSVILLVIASSLYYFPIALRIMPSVNSKMIVAVFGLLIFLWNHLKGKSMSIRGNMLPILALGLVFSLSSFFSTVYNSTDDMVFATYFTSMCVWLGGAYCIISLLRMMYGKASLHGIFLYLGIMCACQCVIAVLIDNIPSLAVFVSNTFTGINLEYFKKNPRLYGIGASFDGAGIRFSCVLLGLAYLIKGEGSHSKKNFYILLFLIIGIVGNMISRTTVVGLAVAFIYVFATSLARIKARVTANNLMRGLDFCIMIIVLYNVGIYMYNTMPGIRSTFEYGFEGFINFVETGTFFTHSSDLLLNHIEDIWPDNTKTWLIGDGYFADPYDPSKFYMGTDMGYVRFFFYCGVFGFAVFLLYFLCCTYILCRRWHNMTMFFVLLFVIQLVVWIKIPTDIFCFYALLLLADTKKIENYDTQENTLLLAQQRSVSRKDTDVHGFVEEDHAGL